MSDQCPTRAIPMHILMVAPEPFFRPRGTPLSVLHRVRALTRLGHTVELVTYPFGESPAIPGLTIHRTVPPPFVRDVAVGPSVAKLLLDGPLAYTSMRLAASGRFDLIHTHEEAGWVGCHIRRRYGLPHLYDMHSSLPQQLANFKRFRNPLIVAAFERLERQSLKEADAVVVICPALRDHVLASGYKGPLALIENTLDFDIPPPAPDAVESVRQRLDLADGPVVVYTGTLEGYQGLELLIAAVPRVLESVTGARLVVVGGTEHQIAALRRLATDLAVADAVRFVPTVPPDQVSLYHKLADVLVTTRSRGTNTPLKVYQYLRSGRPIVATDIRSHTQVLDPSVAELVGLDPGAIAAGISRVLLDPVRGQALATAAARLAEERYSEAQYMRSLENLLAALSLPAPELAASLA
jgi:glycosyltransferase involved in cell wall biosynthesis